MLSYERFTVEYEHGKRKVIRQHLGAGIYAYYMSEEPVSISTFQYRLAYSQYVLRTLLRWMTKR